MNAQADNGVEVEIFDNEAGGCGFLSFDQVHERGGEATVQRRGGAPLPPSGHTQPCASAGASTP